MNACVLMPMLAAVFGAGPLLGQVDTARPPLPPSFRFPADTSRSVAYPYDTAARFYRDLVVIQIQDTVSGIGVRALFSKYRANVIGGLPEWPAYVVRVPDPGPSYEDLDSLLSKIAHDPRVRLAFGITFHGAYSPQGAVGAAADTSRPFLPATSTGFFPEDTAFSVTSPDAPGLPMYRRLIAIRFDDSTSGRTIRSLFRRYRASVVSGLANFRAYIVRVPDPGPSMELLDSLVARVSREPGVDVAFGLSIRGVVERYGQPEQPTPAGTGRPAIPDSSDFPDDTTRLLKAPDDSVAVFYGTMAEVLFADSVTGSAVRSFLTRHRATIVGGDSFLGSYVVQFPDPGPAWEQFQAVLHTMEREVGVLYVVPLTRRAHDPEPLGTPAPSLQRQNDRQPSAPPKR